MIFCLEPDSVRAVFGNIIGWYGLFLHLNYRLIIEEVRDMENYYRGPKGRDDNW